MAKTTGKEIAKNAIENQIDFVLNHSSGDTQRGIAYGMIDASANNLLNIKHHDNGMM